MNLDGDRKSDHTLQQRKGGGVELFMQECYFWHLPARLNNARIPCEHCLLVEDYWQYTILATLTNAVFYTAHLYDEHIKVLWPKWAGSPWTIVLAGTGRGRCKLRRCHCARPNLYGMVHRRGLLGLRVGLIVGMALASLTYAYYTRQKIADSAEGRRLERCQEPTPPHQECIPT